MFILLKNENKNIVAGIKFNSSDRLEFKHIGTNMFGDDDVRLGFARRTVPSENRTLSEVICRAIIPGFIIGTGIVTSIVWLGKQ
ncbi:hypothetical protein EBR43_13985 [bacterium]|nr:hypothetical protein [bacterium]